jgi:NADH-quinone oxidoreductase subunit L
MSGEQDMRNMGDLAGKIPVTFRTMFVATLAIAGIPAFAGFFSKDEILWKAWQYHWALWAIGFATALMTAFYMFRLIYLTFWSPSRVASHEIEHHIHESTKSMTVPLVILAFFSITAGYLGVSPSLGGSNHFEKFLEPVFANHMEATETPASPEEGPRSTEYLLMGLSVAAAFAGLFLARRAYLTANKGYTEPIAAIPAVYNTLLNKYYVDEGYDYVFTGRRKLGDFRLGVMGLGEASSWVDTNVIDGAVNAAGSLTRSSAVVSSWWDKWIIDWLIVNGIAYSTQPFSYLARLFEWGLVQWYALVMTAGLVGFVFYYVYH